MITRRTFMTAASGLMLGPQLAAQSAQGANDRIRIGVIGTGGRARGLMNNFRKRVGVELAAVCDVYEPSRGRIRRVLKGGLDLWQKLAALEIELFIHSAQFRIHIGQAEVRFFFQPDEIR
jgi:hypothetical protein